MKKNMARKKSTESIEQEPLIVDQVLQELADIRAEMVAEPELLQSKIKEVHPCFRESARNLIHYLVLRRRDLRTMQARLASLGLSSLGRAESHALANVDAVLNVLRRLSNSSITKDVASLVDVDFHRGHQLLTEHTESLLGPSSPGRNTRIMVTMPSEAGDDYTLIHGLLEAGMDCMRINCAHDDASTWGRMIEHLRRAEKALGRNCRVMMDLAGPKLRTGPLEPGPAVLRIRPQRNEFGRVVAPARIWLINEDSSIPAPSDAEATLVVPSKWLAALNRDDRIHLTDARDCKREMKIIAMTDHGCWAEAIKTMYIVPGTVLRRRKTSTESHGRDATIRHVPHLESFIPIHEGDQLILTRDQQPGRPPVHDSAGRLLTPATIGCTIPEVFEDVQAGQSIWFDDGKIGGVISKVDEHQVHVRITHARSQGEKLRADKGINLPESALRLDALTEKDLEDLRFVAAHADVVELSFANTAHDVESLQRHLANIGSRQPSIVLKIETRRGFEHLPEMLLAAMRAPCCGVMIARGDLAVECGFERLAEIQEEILWICEAAHVPVIWATQVLESLAKDGLPSRAEITDAAMGHRAECVMLNKGPHMLKAVDVLDNILQRMQSHQTKKKAMLRELRLAHMLALDPREQ
jgi:pyruvate kinase